MSKFVPTRWTLAIAAGVIAVSGVALATGAFERLFDPTRPATIQIESWPTFGGEGHLGPRCNLMVHRGPVLPNHTLTLQFDLSVAAPDALSSAVLQTATDANLNGILDASEWLTVANGVISSQGGLTLASTPSVTVSNSSDGYRVIYSRLDGPFNGTSNEHTWVSNPAVRLPQH